MFSGRLSSLLTTVLLTGAVFASSAQAVPVLDRDINNYVLFAFDELSLKGGSVDGTWGNVIGGHVGANSIDLNPADSDSILSISGHSHPIFMSDGTQLVADSIRSGSDLSSYFDVFANTVNSSFSGTIRDAGPLSFVAPIIDPALLPTLPAFVAGVVDFVVAPNTTDTIAPGDYALVNPKDGSTLTFGPGVYNIKELHIGKDTTIITDPGTIINIAEKMNVGNGSVFGSASGIAQINVRSDNQHYGNDLSVNLGKSSVIYAYIFAPDGSLALGHSNELFGHFWAKGIHSDFNINVTHIPSPEPATVALLGLAGVATYRRRRAQRAQAAV